MRIINAFSISADDAIAFNNARKQSSALNRLNMPNMRGRITERIINGEMQIRRNLFFVNFSVVLTNPPHGRIPMYVFFDEIKCGMNTACNSSCTMIMINA